MLEFSFTIRALFENGKQIVISADILPLQF